MAKTTTKPAKPTPRGSEAPKGGHYTPPNASKELPASFYKPLDGKERKKGEIPDD